MAQTVEDLQLPQVSWGAELRNYERSKRHVVDEGLLRGPGVRVPLGAMKSAERFFDPLLQRYRDGGTEYQQRLLEETERVAHLNRAKDIQIIREQPFDIIRHESKLDGIDPRADPARLERRTTGNPENCHPDTAVDYNLLSNLPCDVHHWARPDRRPRCIEKPAAKQRSVPGYEVKDFNIVTNRYVDQHDAKSNRDRTVGLHEAIHKDATQNRFNPVTQQFNDPHYEECARTCDDAHGVELQLRADAQLPPSFKGRESSFYNVVTHKKHDPGMLTLYDEAESQRKDRYNNRYIMEHNWHAQDIKGDHITNVRKLNRTAPERFEETSGRGFDILSNRSYGHGPKDQTLYAPFAQPRLTPWAQATRGSRSRSQCDMMSATMPVSGRFGDTCDSRSVCGRSMRSCSSQGNTRASVYSGRAG